MADDKVRRRVHSFERPWDDLVSDCINIIIINIIFLLNVFLHYCLMVLYIYILTLYIY